MKANKAVKENATHIVTKSLCDENGKPLEWEFRHITSKENEEIRENTNNYYIGIGIVINNHYEIKIRG